MYTASKLQPTLKCTHYSVGDGAQQWRGQPDREAREVEREGNGGTWRFWREVDAGVRELGGATAHGGAINSLYDLLVTSISSFYVLS